MKDKTEIVKSWLKGWCLSREVAFPVQYKSGFNVFVGDEKQKERYVFPNLNEDFFQLARSIDEPWVYLKVSTSPDQFIGSIPEKWQLQAQGYLMTCFHPMIFPEISLAEGYHLEFSEYNTTFVVRIVAENGEQASIGRVSLIDDAAVYDRIITEIQHQRKGLASFLLKELEKIALLKGFHNNLLVATEEGKLLYENLGWKVYALHSSIVIPSKD
ncbi:GNAT family N-acetyltransferase [Chryseobacterium sp. BIGb0232]|uniref:GNAT family N-acetyltransferase n=1 Tax=Chryseobacterium sp. BIGb0232 TaxID=2940598 RepID=UPI000F4A53C8|nr:GNAT family N-acetyltransferase [Chryseobacterium sp. BIGb0232]MCS4304722.1 GNAT superfamily N-acetyltransferase [Chryseobacterium sp. BIGb0232]ROS20621.1 acetyltransferase (GNAT) family protein [Chryseobacterium nakagawai]